MHIAVHTILTLSKGEKVVKLKDTILINVELRLHTLGEFNEQHSLGTILTFNSIQIYFSQPNTTLILSRYLTLLLYTLIYSPISIVLWANHAEKNTTIQHTEL